MSLFKTIVCLAVFVLAAGTGVAAGQVGDGETLVFDDGRETRLLSEPGGEREDNNGGCPFNNGPSNPAFALIGNNVSNRFNYMVYGFDLSPFSGATTTGDATVTITKTLGAQASNAGSVDDIITVSELAITNSGWTEGTGIITFADTPADDGSVSFLNRAQFTGSGVSQPWLDAGGNAVSNLAGAITPVASRPGYNFSEPNGTQYELIIPQATAQRWLDDGLAGLVFSADDSDPITGDNKSRFNLSEIVSIRFQTTPDFLLGDVNLDGTVSFLDVAPFISLLASGEFQAEADTNQDNLIDFRDILPFVGLLQ